MTPFQIEKKYASLILKRIKLDEEFIKFKSSIKEVCHHPEKYIHSWTDQKDNGYGRWWNVQMRTCMICGKKL